MSHLPLAHVHERAEYKMTPTINDVFGVQPGIMAGQVTKLLNERLHGSIAPLLLMTDTGLRNLNGFGKSRILFVKECLEAAGLRLRLQDERVHARARRLFGSVDETPAQAMLIISALDGGNVTDFYVDSPAVRLVTQVSPGITIGDLFQACSSVGSLTEYFNEQGVDIDVRRVRAKHDELSSRLAPWIPSLSRQ